MKSMCYFLFSFLLVCCVYQSHTLIGIKIIIVLTHSFSFTSVSVVIVLTMCKFLFSFILFVQRYCCDNEKHVGNSVSWHSCCSCKLPCSISKTCTKPTGTYCSVWCYWYYNGWRSNFSKVGFRCSSSMVLQLACKQIWIYGKHLASWKFPSINAAEFWCIRSVL